MLCLRPLRPSRGPLLCGARGAPRRFHSVERIDVHRDHLPGSFFGPSNLVDLLRHRAHHQGDDVGFRYLIDGESRALELTYAELDRRAQAIGATLQSMDLVGERALLLYPSGLEFVAAFFGCLYAGVMAVPAYPPRRNRNMARIEAIAHDADAKIALTTQGVLERVQTMISETPDLQKIRWRATDRWDIEVERQWQPPDVHGDTLAFLQYTSGSTGMPKGVVLSHSNLMHNSAMIAYAFEHTRSGSGVFWLPLYHDMGLIGGILQPLYMGKSNTLMSPTHFLQKPVRWLEAMSNTGATISGGPNFAFDLCVEKVTPQQKATLDLSRWMVAFNGAEPVRADTIQRFCDAFESCGFRREAFYPCFGLAEATLIVAGGYKTSPPAIRSFEAEALERHEVAEAIAGDVISRDLVGCGGNLLDQQIRIVDPETRVRCPENRVGEIWVSGPSVANGYWRRSEETTATFRAAIEGEGGQYLRTGDLGFLLDGELFVTGRLKDLIIIRGVNHYPQDIEHTVFFSHQQLRPSAGAAFTLGEANDESLVVVQEVIRRRDLDVDEIIAKIRKRIAEEHDLAVDAIVLIKTGSIPTTSSGKVQRHACRDGYQAGTLAALVTWTAATGVTELAASVEEREVPADRIDDQEPVAPGLAGPTGHLAHAANGTSSMEASASWSTAARDKATSHTSQVVFDAVREVAKERAGDLTLETNIVELGLDSLERIQIVSIIENAFGGAFPPDVLPQMETCRDVVTAVERYLRPAQTHDVPTSIPIPDEHFDFERTPEFLRLRENMAQAESWGLPNPYFQVHESVTNDRTTIDGVEYLNFCSYNYLGMSGDPYVATAAQSAIEQFGTSVSASRLVSGEKSVHRQLEREIASFIGTADAIVLVGGHATNETTIGHLFGPGDLILHDSLAHNSIVQGCVLSGAQRRPFPHNDWRACEAVLSRYRRDYRKVLIVIEGVYSMDGDTPDLPRFIELRKRYKTFLMVDEAHSIGTMGLHGRGVSEHFEVKPTDVDLWMGTLSKSFGSCGGYIAGSQAIVEYLKYTAPGFVYSVGLPPANAAAALASLQLLQEEPERVARLSHNSALFLHLAKDAGLNTGMSNQTPIVPIIVGNSAHAMLLSHRLFRRNINVQPILYPAVEESAARLRFFITCLHTEQQIRATAAATAEELFAIDACYRPAWVGQDAVTAHVDDEVLPPR